MCTGLDTVWIGLASGHIIVFGMNPPGEVLTYFRPYHSYVRFLSVVKYTLQLHMVLVRKRIRSIWC